MNLFLPQCNFYCLTCTAGRGRGMCKYCLADHKGCSGRVFQVIVGAL